MIRLQFIRLKLKEEWAYRSITEPDNLHSLLIDPPHWMVDNSIIAEYEVDWLK